MSRRVKDEGESFLTITLPSFAKALERGLESGKWDVSLTPSFRRSGGLPAFMRGFLTSIFDKSGSLLPDPDAECIWAVRQFCYLTHKIERDCTPERVERAFQQYVATDRELLYLPGRIPRNDVELFRRTSESLFRELLQECDNLIANFELRPKHGPGATADRLSPLEKRDFGYWTHRLESVFPFWRYTQNVPKSGSHPDPVAFSHETPVRVVTVPKTQSTPRIIAMEPSSVQYAQQGLKNEIYRIVESGPLSGILDFTDQTRNQLMARKGSLTGELATLDLSEASDRVHWWLVQVMLEPYPHLREYVSATRSTRASVDGHGEIPLIKFASMGSALTFPIEAMIFTILAKMGIESASGTRWSTHRLVGALSVYGDDIIVPTYTVAAVVGYLELFGFKVNRNKSFWNGEFRESCGEEYFRGVDVKVVRLKKELPTSRQDAAELASLVEFRNRLYESGLWGVVKELDEWIPSMIPFLPANDTSSGLVSQTYLPVEVKGRWNAHLHRYERKVPYLHEHSREYKVDGEAGLLEWFHTASEVEVVGDSYASQERPVAFSIYNRWSDRY